MLLLRLLERAAPFGVSVLDLDWDISDDREEPVIIFRAGIGNNAKVIGSATSSELGVPISVDAVRQGFEASPVLPEPLRQALSSSFNADSSYPIYIRFRRTDGYLAMIRWEALLGSFVDRKRKILRLPYYALPSVACAPNDLALVIDPTLTEFSTTLDKTIGDVTLSFAMGNGNTSHLFASRSLADRMKGFNHIKLPTKSHAYDFSEAPYISPQRSNGKPAATIENAYLRWVSDRLGPSPVNSVVFVCKGAIEFGEGVINFPFDGHLEPDVRQVSKSITADDLVTFLMQLGAASCAFIDPTPSGLSGAGLRLLADKLSQNRPGFTIALEPEEGQALHDFFFDVGLWPPWSVFPYSGGYLSYEFPWLELAGDQIIDTLERFTLLRDLVSEYRWLKNAPYGAITHIWLLPKEPMSRWVVAVQRYLEMWAARLLELSEDNSGTSGIEDVITSLRDTVRRFLETDGESAKP